MHSLFVDVFSPRRLKHCFPNISGKLKHDCRKIDANNYFCPRAFQKNGPNIDARIVAKTHFLDCQIQFVRIGLRAGVVFWSRREIIKPTANDHSRIPDRHRKDSS